jgi:deoxyribose-phosphate aldolase
MNSKDILHLVDYTLLKREATESDLKNICDMANLVKPAAVCVFSSDVVFVKGCLDKNISLAAVAAGFPVGSDSPEEIRSEILTAVERGADEIDVVLEPRCDDPTFPNCLDIEKLLTMREAAGDKLLKVIIETPLLSHEKIKEVAEMVLNCGADFVKSCTGLRGSCSNEAAQILAEAVRHHENRTGARKGLKLSGGIKTKVVAESMINIVISVDPSFITPDRFRIGSSSIVNDLI